MFGGLRVCSNGAGQVGCREKGVRNLCLEGFVCVPTVPAKLVAEAGKKRFLTHFSSYQQIDIAVGIGRPCRVRSEEVYPDRIQRVYHTPNDLVQNLCRKRLHFHFTL